MHRSFTWRLLGLTLALGLAGCFCTKPEPEPDSGVEDSGPGGGSGQDGGPDSGVDAGPQTCTKDEECPSTAPRCDLATQTCQPPCRRDDDCAGSATRCDAVSGRCIPAALCNYDYNCQSQDPDDYCYVYGQGCRCAPESTDAGYSGVCRRRHGICEDCYGDGGPGNDDQCGSASSGVFDPPGKCASLPGDTSGKTYCFYARVGSVCPACGLQVDPADGYCKPQSKSCEQVGCKKDADCPSGSVCNAPPNGSTCGVCVPRCRWDFNAKTEAAPGCPPGTTCWVDEANLDPGSIFYGAGRCHAPCSIDQECKETTLNPWGGPKLKCAGEKINGGGLSPKRCRADGECMDTLECPEQPTDSIYLGYCDRGNFSCELDCRLGNDPLTGQAYKDCREPYKCVSSDAGVRECKLKTCVEQGGARIACRRGQFCCGEDKNGDGVADPCPPVNQRELDGCYDAPSPPFCYQCTADDDCRNYTPPGWMGTCANGSKSPSCSALPSKCIAVAQKQDGSLLTICAPSTYNDGTKDAMGVSKEQRGCPAGYFAVVVKPVMVQGENYCNTNADCSVGNDGGICAEDLSERFQDGGHPKACKCNDPSTPTYPDNKSNCPQWEDGGTRSVCRFGISSPALCVESVVCQPSPSMPFQDAGPPTYGCGFTP